MADSSIPIQIGRIADFAQFRDPTEHDLTIVRGDSLELVFRMFRSVDKCTGLGSGAQTLTGLQGRFILRAALDHPFPFEMDVAVDVAAGSGRVTVTGTAADTRALPILGVYDLELNDGTDALRKTVVKGGFTLTRDTAS